MCQMAEGMQAANQENLLLARQKHAHLVEQAERLEEIRSKELELAKQKEERLAREAAHSQALASRGREGRARSHSAHQAANRAEADRAALGPADGFRCAVMNTVSDEFGEDRLKRVE